MRIMPKDYAKTVFNDKPKKAKNTKFVAIIAASLVLVVIGVATLGILNKSRNATLSDNRTGILTEFKTLLAHKKALANRLLPSSPATEEAAIHFEFYNDLPKMQVPLPDVPANAKAPPAAAIAKNKPETNEYILQVAVFKEPTEASQLRVSLLLAGIDVSVSKIHLGDLDIYRVQQGPYVNLATAKTKQQHLLKKGIDSVVKKLS
jgi:cell division protein FtsN